MYLEAFCYPFIIFLQISLGYKSALEIIPTFIKY